jgi:hypothetical protein
MYEHKQARVRIQKASYNRIAIIFWVGYSITRVTRFLSKLFIAKTPPFNYLP